MESKFLEPVWERFSTECIQDGINRDVRLDVMKIALGEKKFEGEFTPWERVVTEIVTGDFFGADRIDYLLRDSQCTGLAYGLFDYHQLIEMLKIIVTPEGGLALGVEENGMESCEALLLARHYMHKRLYQYSIVPSCLRTGKFIPRCFFPFFEISQKISSSGIPSSSFIEAISLSSGGEVRAIARKR